MGNACLALSLLLMREADVLRARYNDLSNMWPTPSAACVRFAVVRAKGN